MYCMQCPLYLWFLHLRVNQPCIENYFVLLSVAVVKTLTKSNVWGARVLLHLILSGHRITEGHQDRNLRPNCLPFTSIVFKLGAHSHPRMHSRTQGGMLYAGSLLAYALITLLYTQNNLPRDGTACGDLGLPTPINNHDSLHRSV